MATDILNQLGKTTDATEETLEEPVERETQPKNKTGKTLDEELIASMLLNGDNTQGMFEPKQEELVDTKKKEKLHEETDKDAKIKTKGAVKPSDKYAEEFQKDMQKNPDKYYVNTPRGQMTIQEAKNKGYDPLTKRFNRNSNNAREQELLAQLNDKDRAAVEKLMDPSQVGLAPADAQALGLPKTSKMIRPAQTATPEQAPAQAPAPAQTQPTGQQPAPDINALLGGNV